MDKTPITFREKVEARYVRRGISACWMWEGSLLHGRPALNLRHVIRFIFEWERGPIPPGHTLWRRDHSWDCRDADGHCRHWLCVNPYHVEPMPRGSGLYRREREWDGSTTEHTTHYLKKQRARRKAESRNDGDDRDSQNLDAADR